MPNMQIIILSREAPDTPLTNADGLLSSCFNTNIWAINAMPNMMPLPISNASKGKSGIDFCRKYNAIPTVIKRMKFVITSVFFIFLVYSMI